MKKRLKKLNLKELNEQTSTKYKINRSNSKKRTELYNKRMKRIEEMENIKLEEKRELEEYNEREFPSTLCDGVVGTKRSSAVLCKNIQYYGK